MNSLQCILAKRSFKNRLAVLSKYSVTLERMLASEFASVYTRELLSDVALKARGQEDIDVEPSEELLALRDDFPSILRGSLFVYVVNSFEIQAEAYLIGLLGKDKLNMRINLEQIGDFLKKNLPSTIDPGDIQILTAYKYVRDACAHSEGQVTRVLRNPLKVSNAVQKIPGVIFQPLLQCGEGESIDDLRSFTPEQLAIGRVEFTNEFIPAAIAFFQERFARITG